MNYVVVESIPYPGEVMVILAEEGAWPRYEVTLVAVAMDPDFMSIKCRQQSRKGAAWMVAPFIPQAAWGALSRLFLESYGKPSEIHNAFQEGSIRNPFEEPSLDSPSLYDFESIVESAVRQANMGAYRITEQSPWVPPSAAIWNWDRYVLASQMGRPFLTENERHCRWFLIHHVGVSNAAITQAVRDALNSMGLSFQVGVQ